FRKNPFDVALRYRSFFATADFTSVGRWFCSSCGIPFISSPFPAVDGLGPSTAGKGSKAVNNHGSGA
ncbi:hypothetical protein JW916_03165, partial [Candidatus Sumerlaeota bacterium]|nr:hypothetical protein [Candidatus Sumerlaeota bacterium]